MKNRKQESALYRTRLKDYRWVVLIFVLLLIPTGIRAQEADTQEERSGYLMILPDKKSISNEKDRFKIIIRCPDQTVMDLEIGMEETNLDGKRVILSPGEYRTESIEYIGTDTNIMEEVFGTDASFTILEGEETPYVIYIGDDAVSGKKDIVFGYHKEPEINEKEELSSQSVMERKDPPKEEVTEKVEQKKEEEKTKFSLSRIRPLLLAGIAGMIGILMWNNKK
ncbi:MAG: hypothetical protein IJH60_00415 [Eubacterium sp.]|nr:hypothetical protein [Eubacterium sp.]